MERKPIKRMVKQLVKGLGGYDDIAKNIGCTGRWVRLLEKGNDHSDLINFAVQRLHAETFPKPNTCTCVPYFERTGKHVFDCPKFDHKED